VVDGHVAMAPEMKALRIALGEIKDRIVQVIVSYIINRSMLSLFFCLEFAVLKWVP
jgi:hypothetical protein